MGIKETCGLTRILVTRAIKRVFHFAFRMPSVHHLTEEQIDSSVLESSMPDGVLEHLFECNPCFEAYENTRLLVLALRPPR